MASKTHRPFDDPSSIRYIRYNPAHEDAYVAAMRQLISKDLSEPYSIYVYRYFLYQWGDLCFLAMDTNSTTGEEQMVGVVVSKLEPHRHGPMRGYIAMLAVQEEYRGKGVATKLVRMAIDAMEKRGADEVCIDSLCLVFLWLNCGLSCSQIHGLILMMDWIDRPRNRDHEYGCNEALRTAWIPAQ
jgi:ribosomal protein S18 acetylase RimI-like enzyme